METTTCTIVSGTADRLGREILLRRFLFGWNLSFVCCFSEERMVSCGIVGVLPSRQSGSIFPSAVSMLGVCSRVPSWRSSVSRSPRQLGRSRWQSCSSVSQRASSASMSRNTARGGAASSLCVSSARGCLARRSRFPSAVCRCSISSTASSAVSGSALAISRRSRRSSSIFRITAASRLDSPSWGSASRRSSQGR